jgi:hypothetical protein
MIEIYWATDVHNWQPYGDPLDLDATEDDLLAEVERVARQTSARSVAAPPTVAPSLAAVNSFSAKATGHREISSPS